MLEIYTSKYAIGAVLLPQQEEKNPKQWVPVGYWCITFPGTEANYSTTE